MTCAKREPMSTRDVVETAIDLRKDDKASTWDELTRRLRGLTLTPDQRAEMRRRARERVRAFVGHSYHG